MFSLEDVYGELHGLTEGRPVEQTLTGREILITKPNHRFHTTMTDLIALIDLPHHTATETHVCESRTKTVQVVGGVDSIELHIQGLDGKIETIEMKMGDEESIPAKMAHAIVNRGHSTMKIRIANSHPPVPGDVKWRTSPPDPQLTLAKIEESAAS